MTKKALLFVVAFLAITSGVLGAGRDLKGLTLDLSKLSLPGLSLIPESLGLGSITDFLPTPEELGNLPTMDEFLAKTGLPTWDQLGLPPLSELMKPVADFGELQLPSVDEVIRRSQEVLDQTIKDLLPAGVKLPSLPKIDLSSLAKQVKLPSLDEVLGGLGKIDFSKLGIKLPTGLPPLEDVLASLQPIAEALSKLPKLDLSNTAAPVTLPSIDELLSALPPLPDNLPSLDEMTKAINALSALAKLG